MLTLRYKAGMDLDKVQNFNFRWCEFLTSAKEGVCVCGVVDIPVWCLINVTKLCVGSSI